MCIVNIGEEFCFEFRKILFLVREVYWKGVMIENYFRILDRKIIDEMLKNW